MYAEENTVRGLCRNMRTGPTLPEIQAAAEWADAYLDGKLSMVYDPWPIAPVPNIIKQTAALLTAYRLESEAFAQNEAGGLQMNPYALGMKRDADRTIKEIRNGEIDIAALTEDIPTRSRDANVAAYGFQTVSGFSGRADRNQRRRTC